METVIDVKHIKKYFAAKRRSLFSARRPYAKAVDDISFALTSGETFALVGESGCGKTTTTKLLLLLEKADAGEVVFQGANALEARGEALKRYRRAVQAVFQDPYSSLDPRMRVGSIVAEPLRGATTASMAEIREKAQEALNMVRLNPNASRLFPHEFSGGQRQRIAVARALAIRPAVMILDEPVSALDVSIRAQIMNLLKDLQAQFGMAYLLIAHDLATVRYMSKRVGIMYLGQIVEESHGEDLFRRPYHPYTQALLSAARPFNANGKHEAELSGEVPSPFDPPAGCRFHPRCPKVMPACSRVEPRLRPEDDDHSVACHLYHKIE